MAKAPTVSKSAKTANSSGKVKFTTITIRDAERAADDSRLYVLNRSDPAGNINFNITDSAGIRQVLTVPLSSAPVDLSNFAEKVNVLRNPDFRRLVAKGVFFLVDNDQAEEFCTKDPRGIKETRRIFENISEGNDGELGLTDEPGTTEFEDSAARSQQERIGAGSENPFIENMIGRSKGEEDAADLISECDAKLHTLNLADLEYLSRFSANAELKAWAAQEYEDKKADEAS